MTVIGRGVAVCSSWMTPRHGRGSPVSEDAAAGRTPRCCHAALSMNVNMSIIPNLWKMFKCKHCNASFASIRTARNHHIKCPAVKDSQLACREFSGCACDSCFDEPSQPIEFVQMAPILPPCESDSASDYAACQSAMERDLGFSKKAEKIFGGKKQFIVNEQSEEEADSAWALMAQLQTSAENCCSAAAIQVNRNRSDTGLKRKSFKPLRSFSNFLFEFDI